MELVKAWPGEGVVKNVGGGANQDRFRGQKNYCNKGFPCGGVHPSRLFPPACACLPRGGVLFGREGNDSGEVGRGAWRVLACSLIRFACKDGGARLKISTAENSLSPIIEWLTDRI